MLAEDATGAPYTRPVKYWDNRESGEEIDLSKVYVRLPPELWTTGWIHVLSPAAVAILLVLLLVTRNGKRHNTWVSMSDRLLYGLYDRSPPAAE